MATVSMAMVNVAMATVSTGTPARLACGTHVVRGAWCVVRSEL